MRILALLLALLFAPQAALASVAAFPETALRGDREISAIRVGSTARQLADGRQETACFYDSNASAMTDDPINHRDPTGRLLDVLAVGLLFGPKAAAGYAVRVGQHLLSALADTTSTMCGPACGVLDAALGRPLRPETALEQDSQAGFLERLNPLNQALRSGLTAVESSGFDRGAEIADTGKAVLDTAFLAVGGAKLMTSGANAIRGALDFEATFGKSLPRALDDLARSEAGAVEQSMLRPTFQNLGEPMGGTLRGILTEVDGVYTLDGELVSGRFDFVVRGGRVRIGNGHYFLAEGGKPVEYAGSVHFDNGRVLEFTNGSGHYRPHAMAAENARLKGPFRALSLPFGVGVPQLPVWNRFAQ